MKKKRCAFSIAEAMITLLIVSLAMAAMAPIMSKKIKSETVSGRTSLPPGMIAFFDRECARVNGGWEDVPASWRGRYPRIAGSYNICDKNGERADGTCAGETGILETVSFGQLRGDASRKIEGTIADQGVFHFATGVFEQISRYSEWAGNSKYKLPVGAFSFDTSRVVPTAEENRVKEVGLFMCRKQ